MRCDVAVVGAGPAGSTTARLLAERGASVALIEQCPLPRTKTCGGGLVARALQGLMTDVTPAIEQECRDVEVRLPGSRTIVCRRATPVVSMTTRAHLDLLLAERARDAGATLLTARTVTDIATDSRGVTVTTNHGTVRCAMAVAADGATGTVSRTRFDALRHAAPALELEIAPSDRVLARFGDRARFDFGIIPRGYCWVFPKREHLSVGVVSLRRGRVNLGRALTTYLGALGIDPGPVRPRGSLIPIRPCGQPWVRGRVLAVGDAAGLADPLTAEGISGAVLSGRLAAAAVTRGDLNPDRSERIYGRLLRRTLLKGLSVSRFVARLVYAPGPWQRRVYTTAGSALAELILDLTTGAAPWRTVLRTPGRTLATGHGKAEPIVASVP